MESSLIRVLPACLTEPLPRGWDRTPAEFVIEVMPEVEHPEVVVLALDTTEPDILLLDADFPDADPFAVTKEALAARPGLAVVLISQDSSAERLHRAMLAGVEEYLIRPLDIEQLRDGILNIASNRDLRQVVQEDIQPLQSGQSSGIVVGVVSGKGGLGKTTIAANLATLLAKSGGKTAALIGLESGDGEVLLSLQPKLGLLDMASNAQDDNSITNVLGMPIYAEEWIKQFGTSHRSGLTYWSWQGSATQGGEIPDNFLFRLFEGLRNFVNVSIIDFPLLSPDEAQTVLPLLDIIVVVSSSSDLLALRSTKTFLDMVPPEIEQRVRLVINRADPADMLSQTDFEQALNKKVAAVLPNQPEIAAQAINMGSPFILTQSNSELAIKLQALGQTLFKLPTPDLSNKPKRRFMLF